MLAAFAVSVAYLRERASRPSDVGWKSIPVLVQYKKGTEVLVVFVGSEGCKVSLQPGFNKVIRQMNILAGNEARQEGKLFSTLGVSAGNSASAGVEYLRTFAPFDQISAGHGWLNNDSMRYIWQDHPGEAAIPQVIVISRSVTPLNPGFSFSDERVIARLVGVSQIRDWVARGTPLS